MRLFLSAALIAGFYPATTRAQDLVPAFDYSVPERFSIPEVGKGSADRAGELYTDEPISPPVWHVDFDACASQGAIVEYRWTIDGRKSGSVSNCLGFSVDFPAEGRYAVSLTAVDGAGGQAAVEAEVVVEDLLIVSLGGGYASGEGVPDVPVSAATLALADDAQEARDAALVARDTARLLAEGARAEFESSEGELDAVLYAQNDYLAARDEFEDACPSLSIRCVNATADLASAVEDLLAALAQAGLEGLGVDDTTDIQTAVAKGLAQAQLVLDIALANLDVAEALLADARDELAAALADLDPAWRNLRCHRSAASAPVQAAAALAADPRTSVTFIHLACSGDTIERGLLGSGAGVAPQLALARELVCGDSCDPEDRQVDAILLSVGRSDVNFDRIVETCKVGEPCFESPIADPAALDSLALLCAGVGGLVDGCDAFVDGVPTLDASVAFFEGLEEPSGCGARGGASCNGLDDCPRAT